MAGPEFLLSQALRFGWRLAGLTLAGALAGAALAVPAVGADETTWTVTAPASPATSPTAHLRYERGNGTLSLSVSRADVTVLDPSPVGIVTQRADLSRGLRFVGRTDRAVVEQYTTTVGKRTQRKSVMTESRFRFEGDNGARLDLLVRVAPDGVAYRYVLPADYGSVLGEASAFNVAPDASAWLARHRRDYENPFVEYTAATAPAADFQMPALFAVDGTYLLLAESALDGSYSGPRLLHQAGTRTYRVDVSFSDREIAVDGPVATPWRVMIVGDLATVTESTLVDDLAPDSKLTDTSWIKPEQVLWTWLAGGREAGQSLSIQKGYVDYAAARGWPYVAVDAGWYFDPEQWDVTDPNWKTNSWIPELVRYAQERQVGIIVWIHYRDLDTAEERADWLPTLHAWGVKGVKIDFMDSESQARLRWYDEILPATAANQLLVNFHGSTIPKGIHRTWPHVMTMEGVHGAEKRTVTTQHLTTLPFTRNLIGSMDYTPEAFHRPSRPTSDAHELGLAVTFESGLQNLAGTPESYDVRPEARGFLEQVPTVWDETRLVSGRPSDHVVMARRSGDRWFLGAGVAGPARTLDVPLRFLHGRYLIEVVRDGEAGLVRESHVVTGPIDRLSVDVVAEGGFAAIACRWEPGRTTCDR
ncbi:glycoside hydrolase family 97 protein [Actinopolymorpha alba]|uniref:glycoside hydrolase family 97 protein n=1 Tax=Actinopolymorpha alba TaxID=533267 RepID=UPI00036AA84E|nr:glycoside hydrolase family 97 protein [Actinopolymorpha alba]